MGLFSKRPLSMFCFLFLFVYLAQIEGQNFIELPTFIFDENLV